MLHTSFILLLIPLILVVVAAAVWLAYRMEEEKLIRIGSAKFKEADFKSIDAIIESVKPEKWDSFIEISSRDLENKLDELGHLTVLKDLLWRLDSARRLQMEIDKILYDKREEHPSEERLSYYVKRLTIKQVDAMFCRLVRRNIAETEDTKVLFELLRKHRDTFSKKTDDSSGPREGSGTAERSGLQIPRNLHGGHSEDQKHSPEKPKR